MLDNVFGVDTLKVRHLTTRENGGQNFVPLGGGQNKLGIRGRFFQSLQKGVEGLGGEHVHFVDDIDLILAYLRRYAHLFKEGAHGLHRTVGSRVQLIDVLRGVFLKAPTRLTLPAGFHVGSGVEAVDGLGQNTGAGGFSYASRPAEQKRLGNMPASNRVFEGGGNGLLSHNRFKGVRPVFTG